MLQKLITYFSSRHMLTNFIVLAVFLGSILAWIKTGKEELPNFELGIIRISTAYPGASPQDVERQVTRLLEDELRGIDGIYELKSTSSAGVSSIVVYLEPNLPNPGETALEIRNKVLSTKLPTEVRNFPTIKVYKPSKKAIIDVGIYLTKSHMLSEKQRRKLQTYAHALENRLMNLNNISEVSKRGYLKQEVQIILHPAKLRRYNISAKEVSDQLKKHNIRKPAGSIDDIYDTKITVLAELDTVKKLRNLVIRGEFDTPIIRLGQIATVKDTFEKNTSITKVNGREGVIFYVYKKPASDILSSQKQVANLVKRFRNDTLNHSGVQVVLLDDESRDVRNRISLISMNGLIGFFLILLMLFIFLDFTSGVWVAMGIPFTFCLTMIAFPLLGYTINNITLAAVIIVMGIIVDDAIVVAENVSRLRNEGMDHKEAAIKGTATVFLPIVASIVTTCAAFIPLFFFSGRFGQMVTFIPPVIFIMLAASLFESTLILPSHLNLQVEALLLKIKNIFIKKLYPKSRKKRGFAPEPRHWFHKVEDKYGKIIEKILHHRWIVMLSFAILLTVSGYLFLTNMKFVMFPREETTELRLSGTTAAGMHRTETAKRTKVIEKMLAKYIGKEVIGFRTDIAKNRRGSVAQQNRFSIRIEIVPRDQRKKSARKLIQEWKRKIKKMRGFKRVLFVKSRFGQSSGSPIEVLIKEDNDQVRNKAAKMLAQEMRKIKSLKNVEIEVPIKNPEYKIGLKRDLINRTGIDPAAIAASLRIGLEGSILYDLYKGDEEVDYRLTINASDKKSIHNVLNIPVANKSGYLVPLVNVVTYKRVKMPSSITRINFRRTIQVYADMVKKPNMSPAEIGTYIEEKIFPLINRKYPSCMLTFGGEIKDTRESQNDFGIAVLLVLFLIYIILALLFNSMIRPIIIMLTIPFGLVGIILTFQLHGINFFGFFSAIGALGLAGVVVNDSIVMIDKLDNNYGKPKNKEKSIKAIAEISKTRLRAVLLTTFTTVAGVMPTAYGIAGYDSMLAEMMLALSWGLLFGTFITLVLVPCIYSFLKSFQYWKTQRAKGTR